MPESASMGGPASMPEPASTREPAGLREAVVGYEAALMANDIDSLDGFFATGADTLRGDAAGLLVGHDAIARYRRSRGGAPARIIMNTHVRVIDDDHALVVTIGAPVRGGFGQQTQLWRKDSVAGWVIDVAHVSAPPSAVDSSVWRTVGTPLLAGSEFGPLARARVAVKDLFAVAGHPVGAGVPAYLAEQTAEVRSAPAVTALLDAGADITGIARTDEFAYSVAGRNPHYGSPPNPAVVGGIPGGSSNGPASAVALGQADIGLGTDTGGSIRVPASYQGLWGLRTTHGAVDRAGLLPLAASFDTVGWLARDAATLRLAAQSSLAPATSTAELGDWVVCDALLALADDDVRDAVESFLGRLTGGGPAPTRIELPGADDLFETFRTVQAVEAWEVHGDWVREHPGALGDDIAARFTWASSFSEADAADARSALRSARRALDAALAGRTLLLPSASSAAPPRDADRAQNEATRASTLRLTCVAGILGAPALSAPLLRVDGGPVGLCLVGSRGTDLLLIDAATVLGTALSP